MSQGATSRDAGLRHYETAWTMFEQKRLDEAEHEFRLSLQHVPDHPLALLGLGIVSFEQGREDDAIVLLRQAAARAPGDAMIANALGEFLCRLGRHHEALPHLERAVALKPGMAQAHNNLGNALGALRRTDEALAHYRRAAALSPAIREPHNNIGILLAGLKRHEEAIAQYRMAIACDPRYIDARVNLGLSLNAIGRHTEALAAFDEAAAVDPSNAAAVLGRGTALQALGRLAEAHAAYARAVAMKPDEPSFHRAVADSRTFAEGDPEIAAMEALAARPLAESDRIGLHFALAKAYDDLGRYDAAFAQMKQGNGLKRRSLVYDESAELASLAAIARAFPRQAVEARKGGGEPSELPVFVVGMPRSGTTLVEQILASHPAVFGAGELPEFGFAATGGYTPAQRAFDMATLSPDVLAAIGARYVAKIRALAPDALRIVDKMPANFMFAGLIHLALPRARIIHIRRDARDTCFSCYARLFDGALDYSYDLSELGRYWRAYETLMAHWRSVLPPGAMLEVDYEAVVGDLETEARRLVAHCGLEWDPRCLAFDKTERVVLTASAYQVRRPIYASSIGRWRHYAKWLGPLIEALK